MAGGFYTCAELAKMELPGLGKTKRGVHMRAVQECWDRKRSPQGKPLARTRAGRGGGKEYHASVLPDLTQVELVRRGEWSPSAQTPSKSADWARFEAATDALKAVAKSRLKAIQTVERLEGMGVSRTCALREASTGLRDDAINASPRTIRRWMRDLHGVSRVDRLPALLPATGRCGRKSKPIQSDIIAAARADYLRPEEPSFESVYMRLQRIAPEQGWDLPPARTLQRRFLDGVPYPVRVLKRQGYDALERIYPPQQRDRTEFTAMEAVNADGHVWDVFVRGEDGSVFRPHMVAVQDLYSNKIVSWRIGRSLGAELVRLAFADMFRDYGIPSKCWLDNGREFASKMVTGGTANRYRFKVKEEEPTGFLTALGVEVLWTRPYRGQSKPIERAFRDFCDHIAKHPKFAGAYTGNKPSAKPENYGSHAVDMATFRAVVDQGIRAHNAREGRRTAVCQGRDSFDGVFARSYAANPVRRATDEQLRQCLLAGEVLRADRHSGCVRMQGNTYWSPQLAEHAGERVVLRFDPDALHDSVHVYDLQGRYVGEAECWRAEGFADVAAGRKHARNKKAFMKAQKELAAHLSPMDVAAVADLLPDIPEEQMPEPSVVAPVFTVRTSGSNALKVEQAQPDIDWDALSERLDEHESATRDPSIIDFPQPRHPNT